MKNQEANIIVTPLKSALLEGHRNKLNVLVRMQAPSLLESSKGARQPYGIAFVIDRSGSMDGQPLEEAVRCVNFMVDRLQQSDVAALVTFDSAVLLDYPLSELSNKTGIKSALAHIRCGGTTNLHGGWREGADEFMRKESNAPIKRVILLSDGCANHGLTDPNLIANEAQMFVNRGVTTSTYGLGRHFNEELMVELARSGQGSHYYAETAEDLLESFNEEFDLLANLWTKESTLQITPEAGVQVKLLNDYREVLGQTNTWHLPNIAHGSEAWAMFEVTVSDSFKGGDVVSLFSVKLMGQDIDGNKIDMSAAKFALPVINGQAYAAIAEDELVRRRLDEVEASHYLKKARAAVNRGDWDAADHLIQEAKAKFKSSPWVQDVLNSMETLAKRRDREYFSKEAMFSVNKMQSRLSPLYEHASLESEEEAVSFLRRKTAQGKAQFIK